MNQKPSTLGVREKALVRLEALHQARQMRYRSSPVRIVSIYPLSHVKVIQKPSKEVLFTVRCNGCGELFRVRMSWVVIFDLAAGSWVHDNCPTGDTISTGQPK